MADKKESIQDVFGAARSETTHDVFGPPTTEIPAEHQQTVKENWLPSLGENLYAGFQSGTAEINKALKPPLTEKASKLYDDLFVTKAENYARDVQTRTKQDSVLKQLPNDLAYSLSNIVVQIGPQLMLGAAAKMRLAAEMSSNVAQLMSRIPDFAVGSGILVGSAAAHEGRDPVVPALERAAINTAFGKVGELEEPANAFAKISLKEAAAQHVFAIPKMMAAGALGSAYEAIKQGRLPTAQELESGIANGGAMGLVFHVLPAFKVASEAKGKGQIDAVHARMKNFFDKPDIANVENHVKEYREIKVDALKLLNNEDIPAEHKDKLAMLLTDNVTVDPATGEIISTGERDQPQAKNLKAIYDQKAEELPPLDPKNLEKGFLHLRLNIANAKILARNRLKAMRISDATAAAVLDWYEDTTIRGMEREPLTGEQERVLQDVVMPLIKQRKQLLEKRNQLMGKVVSAADMEDIIPRDVIGRGTYDNIVSQTKKVWGQFKDKVSFGAVLRTRSGTTHEREMKIITDAKGNRFVAHIPKGGRITQWVKNGATDLGTNKLTRNIDKLEKEISPSQKYLNRLKREKRALESIKVRSPISKARLGDLQDKAAAIAEFLDRPKADYGAAKADYAAIEKELDGIVNQIGLVDFQKATLGKFAGDSEAIDKRLDKLADRVYKLSLARSNLEHETMFNRLKEFVEEGEKEEHQEAAADRRALNRLGEINKEIKILSEIPEAEELVLRRDRIDTLNRKMGEAQDTINGIIGKYNLDTITDKTFTDKNGKDWRIGQATIKEIEANTRVRYYKNPVAQLMSSNFELHKTTLAMEFLENIKDHPDFRKIATPIADSNREEGWKSTKLQAFQGYWVRNEVADAMDHFHGDVNRGSDAYEAIMTLNRVLRNSIFYNPLIHMPNLLVHWVVNRGAMALLPGKGNYHRLISTGIRAFRDVKDINENYLEAMRGGTNLLYHEYTGENFEDLLRTKSDEELKTNPKTLMQVAEARTQPIANVIRGIYQGSGKATWFVNDMLTLQAIYELQDRGMSFDEAKDHVARHLPNYVLPSRILGQRWIAESMKNPMLTMFGAYHYGALKSYGEIGKSLVAGIKGDKKELADAADKIAAIGLVMCVIYPAFDWMLHKASGRKDIQFRRAGSATFIENVMRKLKGQIDPAELLQSMATPAIGTVTALQMYMGVNFFTHKPIYGYGTEVEDAVKFAAGQIGPEKKIENIIEGKDTMAEFLMGFAGIRTSSANAKKYYRMMEATETERKELGKIAEKDAKGMAAQASKFDVKMEKEIKAMLKEDKIKLSPQQLNKFISLFTIERAGPREKTPDKGTLGFIEQKVRKEGRKPSIPFTREQEAEKAAVIDEINKGLSEGYKKLK